MKKLLFIVILAVFPFSFCAAAHPKLFFSQYDVDFWLTYQITLPQYAGIWASIKSTADNYCNPQSSSYLDPNSAFFSDFTNVWYGRDVEGYLEILGFAYQMTGDSKYGLKGAAILDKAANYVLAPPYLPCGIYNIDMPRTYAVGYDWLYTAMTPQQRSRVEALAPTYINWSLTGSNWGPYHNYNGVGYGSMGLFALATEDVYPANAPGWLSQLQTRLTAWFNNGFDAQGSYVEGHSYFQYGFSNGLAFADALLRNKGINIFDNNNLKMVPHYLAQIRLPGESTYEGRNDANFDHYFDVSVLRLAGAVNSPLMEYMWQQGLAYCPTAYDYHVGGLSPMRILWESNIAPKDMVASGEPLAEYFQGNGLVTFRSGWDIQNSLFTIQSRPLKIEGMTHDQADKGHFGFYSLGYYWAADSGYGNNHDPGGRCETEAHSCILIDNVGQALTGASYTTAGNILKYENHPNYGYALADACDAYNINNQNQTGAVVNHALRHAVYVRENGNKPPYAVIFDDIKKNDSNPHNFTWQMISWHSMDVELGGANPLVIPIEYVETPIGSTGTGTCSWTVNVATAGTYELWARVKASGTTISASDSFSVQVDSGSQINWTFPQTTDGQKAGGSLSWVWGWNKVADSDNGGASVTFSLSAGSHVIWFKTRETGAQVAAVFLTNKVGQTPKYTDPTQGILLKAKTATVAAPMVFRPRAAQMEVVMDANSALTYSYDFYQPDSGMSVPRFKANCTTIAPKFATVLIPHSTAVISPAVTFQKTSNGEIVNVAWADRADQIVLSGTDVSVNIGACTFAIPADLNNDCVVDFKDLAILAQSWSMCTDPASSRCGPQGSQGGSGATPDDFRTIALWHMDAAVPQGTSNPQRNYILDDDAVVPGRDNDLKLGQSGDPAGTTEPILAAGGFDGRGYALQFDGSDDIAYAMRSGSSFGPAWNGYGTVNVDLWVKPTSFAKEQEIIYGNSWMLRVETNGTFKTWCYSNFSTNTYMTRTGTAVLNSWNHVILSVQNNLLTLTVNGSASSIAFAGLDTSMTGNIQVGEKSGTTRYFAGLIDEVKITVPSLPVPACGYWGYYRGDFNTDCYVDMKDLNTIGHSWLTCSTPGDPACQQLP